MRIKNNDDGSFIREIWSNARILLRSKYDPSLAVESAELTDWERGPLVMALKSMIEPWPVGRASDKEIVYLFRSLYLKDCPVVMLPFSTIHHSDPRVIAKALDRELVWLEVQFLPYLLEMLEAGTTYPMPGWSIHLRQTADNPTMPFFEDDRITCVMVNLTTQEIKQAKKQDGKHALLQSALEYQERGDSVLLLVAWPGKWSQDVFWLNNLEQFIAGQTWDAPQGDGGLFGGDLSEVKL